MTTDGFIVETGRVTINGGVTPNSGGLSTSSKQSQLGHECGFARIHKLLQNMLIEVDIKPTPKFLQQGKSHGTICKFMLSKLNQ